MPRQTLKQQMELIEKQKAEIERLKAMTAASTAGKFGVYTSQRGNRFLKVDIGSGKPILLTRETAKNLKDMSKDIQEALDLYDI